MTKKEFIKLAEECVQILRDLAPKDTGNLAFNGVRFEWIDDNTFRLYVDGDGTKGIAYYMPFTTEPWLSPKWNGKKNPNEGWFDKACEKIAQHVATRLNGDMKKK